ncbi:MAG: polymerase sigma-70 factor, subfamily [Acidimicrobiaceae bacterium]|jgi:RNA polymerase sigma-70 factor (ECF subfamily)|nr:polymerase sigma-70 factor, subfamily [Acidimicrobiaceae bacterium]
MVAPHAAASTAATTVLVVDDHAAVRAGVAAVISGSAQFVLAGEAGNGAEAVEAAARLEPDLVLLDMSMPVLDGLGALSLLRQLPHPPVVVVFSAWADQAQMAAAEGAGAAGHVLKDAAPSELLRALTKAVAPPTAGEDKGARRRLADQAAGGDAAAWETLYRQTYPKLLAYCRRRLPADEAADAVAETYLRAVRNLARLDWDGGGFDPWLYGIARHVVADQHRSRTRWHRPLPLTRAPAAAGPLDALLHDEEAMAARRAFARLGPVDQEILELRVVGRLCIEQVATVLGKRPGTVRMAQSRALARLRALLAEEVGADAAP